MGCWARRGRPAKSGNGLTGATSSGWGKSPYTRQWRYVGSGKAALRVSSSRSMHGRLPAACRVPTILALMKCGPVMERSTVSPPDASRHRVGWAAKDAIQLGAVADIYLLERIASAG